MSISDIVKSAVSVQCGFVLEMNSCVLMGGCEVIVRCASHCVARKGCFLVLLKHEKAFTDHMQRCYLGRN